MKSDLTAPGEIHLLGVRFHKLTSDQLLDHIIKSGSGDGKTIIANVNVRAMNLAYETPWFRAFLNKADWVFCDGFGVALGARLAGLSIHAKHRSTCPDWIESLALRCAQHDLSIFLLAGKPGVAEAAAIKLRRVAPGLNISVHHGYFKKSGRENSYVIQHINRFKPDILYVGFGMPLQERWIKDNMEKVKAKVFLPLGACLDFYTNQINRSPRWATDHGLEWLGRFVIEPRRLWRRYLIGNPLFLYRVLKQRLGLLRFDE